MFSKCARVEYINMSSLNLIEKWIINECNCRECIKKTKNLKREISKIKIKTLPKKYEKD